MANKPKRVKPPSQDTGHTNWLTSIPEDWELLVDSQDDDMLCDSMHIHRGSVTRKGKRFDPDLSDY
jgi:hypothetical protein